MGVESTKPLGVDLPRGPFWGSLIGFNGWVIGLAAHSALHGAIGNLWDVIVGGFVLSTGVGVLMLVPSRGPGTLDWMGRLGIGVALLTAVYSFWTFPRLEALETLRGNSVLRRVPDVVIVVLAALGVILVAWRRGRQPSQRPAC